MERRMTPTKAKISVEDLQSEVKRLSKALKERDAALAVINSVTEGLASGLEVDAIFELVGKRISKIFSGHAVALYTFDESTEMAEARFMLEKGVRHSPPPFAPGPIGRRTMASKKPLMISTRAEFEAMGAITIEGTEASQSGIYAPLFVHDKVVGAMNIENPDAEHAFSPADLRLVTTLANSVSVALESARLFGELQKSNLEISQALEHQTAMSEILHVLAAAPSDIQTVLAAVAEAAARLCEADDVQIYRVDGNRLPQVAHFGPLPALKDGESLPLVPGLITGRAVLEQRMIHIEDFAKIARDEYPESAKLQKRLKHRSVIVTPLLREGQAIGALVVRRNDVQPFSEKHITLLSTFADQAAIAIENVRLFHETQQRAQELAIINSVQAALAAKLDMQAIYEAVGDKIHEVFSEAQVVDILHYDVDTKLLHPRYVLEKGKRYSVEPWPLRGFRKHIIETGRPLVINQDMQEKMVEYDNDWVVLGEPSKSWIGVPMIVGAAVKGVISLQHLDKENAFSDSDVRLLQTLANSMSVALENARLFDESQRLLKETEERNAELAIINTVQRALSAQLDIRGIYEAVGEKLRQIFDSQTIAIYSADLKQRINTSEYAFEKGQKLDPVSQPFSTLHDHLVELSDTYVFNGDFPEFAAQFVDYRVRAGEMPKSIVGVPIISKQDPDNIVTLTLQDIDGGKIFTDSDVRLLETLANSMSVALENARLFDETQRLLKQTEQRAAELEIINSVQEGLAARSDLQAIYDLIGNTIRDLFSAESMYIAIVDQPENVAHYVYFLAMGERVFGEPPTAPKGFGGHVYTHRQPLRLSDITAETMREYGSNFMGPQNDENMAHSWMGAPISSGDDVLGMVSILNQRKDFFTESDLRLLSTLTNGMGVALENARLFDETQRLLDETKKRAAELQIINSVQEGLASKLNLQDIYDLVGEKIHEIFKADTTFIAFHDQEKAQVIAPYYVDRGEPGLQGSRPYGKGLVEVIIESGQPVLFNTAQESAEAGAFLIASPGSDKDLNEAFIGVPI
ncbi:MAG: GAF domain-containing protein, partial [Anaerolineales bacterium]